MLNEIKEYLLIRNSGYFDSRYYLSKYPDVRKSDADPLMHYVFHGWKEGRYPSFEWEYEVSSRHLRIDETIQINPLIGHIKKVREEKRSSRLDILKILNLFIRFTPSFWRLKGIVFWGGYPYPERERDGYYQRIRSIDTLFKDRWRIYIDSVRLPGRDFWYDIPEPHTLVIRPHGKGITSRFIQYWIRSCILQARVVYFHSVLFAGGKEFFWEYPEVHKVIDVHGAVPEEFKYQGDDNNSQYFDQVESFVVTHANHIVVVSDAMRNHLINKYSGSINGQFINLPNIQEIAVEPKDKPYIDGKPVIIYAGGLQVWQQIPKIIDAIIQTNRLYVYKFFCPDPNQVITMLPSEIIDHHHLEVESKQREEIFREYTLCHYGFILRENRIVNNVACPTKLVEYLAMGVIPIVDYPEMGDFKVLGMQYTNLEALLKNQLPSESDRRDMAEQNYSVYLKILNQYKAGAKNLQQSIPLGGKHFQ